MASSPAREATTEKEDSGSEGEGSPQRKAPTENPRKDSFLKCMLHTLVNHRSLLPPLFPFHVKELDVKAHSHGPFYDGAGQRVKIQDSKARCDNHDATQFFASGQLWRDIWLHQTEGMFSGDYKDTGGGYLSTQLRRVFPNLAKPMGAYNLIFFGPTGYSQELIEGLKRFLRREEYACRDECGCMNGFRLQLFGHSKTAHERDAALAEARLLRAQNEKFRELAADQGWDADGLAGITEHTHGSSDPPEHPYAPISQHTQLVESQQPQRASASAVSLEPTLTGHNSREGHAPAPLPSPAGSEEEMGTLLPPTLQAGPELIPQLAPCPTSQPPPQAQVQPARKRIRTQLIDVPAAVIPGLAQPVHASPTEAAPTAAATEIVAPGGAEAETSAAVISGLGPQPVHASPTVAATDAAPTAAAAEIVAPGAAEAETTAAVIPGLGAQPVHASLAPAATSTAVRTAEPSTAAEPSATVAEAVPPAATALKVTTKTAAGMAAPCAEAAATNTATAEATEPKNAGGARGQPTPKRRRKRTPPRTTPLKRQTTRSGRRASRS